MGTRRIRLTLCNVPANLPREVVASYLSAFGRVEEMTQLRAFGQVEEMTQLRAISGATHADYTFRLCLGREGFQAIPDPLYFRYRQMLAVVKSKRPRCWNCKQVGHLAKVCPQKAADLVQRPGEAETTTTTDSTKTNDTTKTTDTTNATPEEETSNEWTRGTRRRKKKGEEPPKESTPTKSKTPPPPPPPVSQSTPSTQETPLAPSQEIHQEAKKATSPRSKDNQTSKETPMNISQNPKRRRDSREGLGKKILQSS